MATIAQQHREILGYATRDEVRRAFTEHQGSGKESQLLLGGIEHSLDEFPAGKPSTDREPKMHNCFRELMADYKRNSIMRQRADCRYQEFRPSLSKPIIDQIDTVLAEHYGFTEEDLDFFINYDIKYCMGLGGKNGEKV